MRHTYTTQFIIILSNDDYNDFNDTRFLSKTTDNDKSIKCRTFRPEGLCQLRTDPVRS